MRENGLLKSNSDVTFKHVSTTFGQQITHSTYFGGELVAKPFRSRTRQSIRMERTSAEADVRPDAIGLGYNLIEVSVKHDVKIT